jgi:hypothetical protein
LLYVFEAASFHFKADSNAPNKISGNTPGIERFHSCLQSYRDVFCLRYCLQGARTRAASVVIA